MTAVSRTVRFTGLIVLLCSQLLACGPKKSASDSQVASITDPIPCKTQYPVLLVHGVAQRDLTIGMNYFGRIPAYLKDKCKIEVFMGGADAFSVSEVNAKQLLKTIAHITDDLGYDKVHIIAHSKGGIDVRFMVHKYQDTMINGLPLTDRIASFTTLGTPHRGSSLADFLLGKIDAKFRDVIGNLLNIYGVVMGDSKEIDSRSALEMLSSASMKRFNEDFADLDTGIEGIPCQSWASNVSGVIQDPILKSTSLLMREIGSPINDGAVQEESAHYANYRGLVGQGVLGGVSHMAIVDRAALFAPGITPGFDARKFYEQILTELAQKGL